MLEGILTITFQNPRITEVSDPSEKSLFFEQRDWSPYAGKVTIGTLANAIANMIYDDDPRGAVGGGMEIVGDATIGGGGVYGEETNTYEEPLVIYREPVVISGSDVDLSDNDLSQGEGLISVPVGHSRSFEMVDYAANPYSSSTSATTSAAIVENTGADPSSLSTQPTSPLQGKRPATVSCALNADGELVATVYAYANPSSLNFTTRLTHGHITSHKQVTDEFEEIILFRLSDNERTSYPVSRMSSSEWVGDVYDVNGAIINPPSKSYSNNYFSLSRRVYGSLLVKYKVKRHIFEIAIPESDEEENRWDTVIYANFDGGVSWLEVRGDESNSLDGTECTKAILSTRDSADDEETEEGDPSNRYTRYDYCTQDIISDHYS